MPTVTFVNIQSPCALCLCNITYKVLNKSKQLKTSNHKKVIKAVTEQYAWVYYGTFQNHALASKLFDYSLSYFLCTKCSVLMQKKTYFLKIKYLTVNLHIMEHSSQSHQMNTSEKILFWKLLIK